MNELRKRISYKKRHLSFFRFFNFAFQEGDGGVFRTVVSFQSILFDPMSNKCHTKFSDFSRAILKCEKYTCIDNCYFKNFGNTFTFCYIVFIQSLCREALKKYTIYIRNESSSNIKYIMRILHKHVKLIR